MIAHCAERARLQLTAGDLIRKFARIEDCIVVTARVGAVDEQLRLFAGALILPPPSPSRFSDQLMAAIAQCRDNFAANIK
jgi:hypothetical protein